jgi:hypothetical protein
MRPGTYQRAISALGRALIAVNPGVTLSASGYADNWSNNLLPGTDPTWFETELNEGDGRELVQKFKAAHSSSALVINTFARFKSECSLLAIANWAGCETFRFEAKCSAGIRDRHPPNLDLLAQSPTVVLGIESKCTEHLRRRTPKFSPAYDDQIKDSRRTSAWFHLMTKLKVDPTRYCYLDAAQLIKHAFGLAYCFPNNDPMLLYLYWEPRNANTFPEFQFHREEVARFANDIEGSSPSFKAISYQDLWDEWRLLASPAWLSEHLTALRARYDIAI